MIKCKDLIEEASDYLDGDMPLGKRIGLFFHLLICHSCRNYMQQIRRTIKTVSVLRPREKDATDKHALAQKLHSLNCKHN
jgi:predicted anti-sigma-YlaC factor YlaD